MPTIQAEPTLQVRGIIMAQYISVSATQSGRNGSAHPGNGITVSMIARIIVTMTGRRPDPLLIGQLLFTGLFLFPDQHDLAHLVEQRRRASR